MAKMFSRADLANTVLDTAKIREESYQSEKYEIENEKSIAKSKADNPKGYYEDHIGVDPARYYGKSTYQSAEEACKKHGLDPEMAQFIDLSFHWWNDILDWAEKNKH